MRFEIRIFSFVLVIFLISCAFNDKYIDRLIYEIDDYELSKDYGLIINLSILNSSDRDVNIPVESFFLGDYNPSSRGRRGYHSFLIEVMEKKEQITIPSQNKIKINLFMPYDMVPIATDLKKEKYPLTLEFSIENKISVDIGYIFVNTSEME